MKAKIYKLSIIIFVSLTFFFGCSEDFLDTQPQGSFAPENFFKTDADATASIMSCYNMLQAIYSTPWSTLWMVKEFPSDEIYSAGAKLGDQPPADELNQFKYGSNNAVLKDVYRMAYFIIYRANIIIDNFEGDTEYKKDVIAEAKAIRAYMYFELVTLWGPVPLVLHELTPDQYEPANTPVTEIWAQIESDLNDAIAELPVRSDMADAGLDKSRVSQGTAQALLGKALLYQKKYNAAATVLQALISTSEYTIIGQNFANVLRKSSEFGPESVFEISFSSAKNNGWGTPNIWNNPVRTAQDNRLWQLCGPRGDQGFDGGTSGINGGWGFGYPTFEMHQAFKDAGDSVRLQASIMIEPRLVALGGKFRNADGNYPWGSTGMVRLKYGTWDDETVPSSVAQPELNYGTNFRIIRYADVLLMAAEAYNRSTPANDGSALVYLNDVRARVNLPALSLAGDALFEAIKNERRLEFAFEGSRLPDLIRWGDAATTLANVGKSLPTGTITGGVLQYMNVEGAGFKAHNVLFPFPYDEILANSNIVQNFPGSY